MNELKLALIGKDVSQSSSKKIHEFILNKLGYSCHYELLSLKRDELVTEIPRLMSEFDGFNVTIPYKSDVIPYLNEISNEATIFEAVNTVVCKTKNGYNTDGIGFIQMLQSANVELFGKKVLVLGAGGAGRSLAISLKQAGAQVFLYRRNRIELEKLCAKIGATAVAELTGNSYDIIINATGVGMHDTVGKSPVGAEVFLGTSLAVDLIYNPLESEFLRLAKVAGVRILNGEGMLFYQAYYSDCRYLNKEPSRKQADEFYLEYCEEENSKRSGI